MHINGKEKTILGLFFKEFYCLGDFSITTPEFASHLILLHLKHRKYKYCALNYSFEQVDIIATFKAMLVPSLLYIYVVIKYSK